ncbi:hypothetical protein ACB092_02G088900 [Castanea dentata]
MTTSEREVAKVQREKLAACMTCPLCNKLFIDATTISECLHTFCRGCIYEKLTDEEVNSCPVCNIDLGCSPLEKLRADHNVQDLRAKLFPLKIKKAVAPEAVPLVPLLGKRKERSLSSLGVSTPSVSAQSVLIGRRMKSAARKRHFLQESTHSVDRPVNEVEDDKTMEDSPVNLSSLETLCEIPQNGKQNSSNTESSKQNMSNKDTEDHAKPCEGKTDMWKPLNELVEAASKTRPIKLTRHGPVDKPVLSDGRDNETNVPKTKIKEHGNKLKGHGDENGSTPTPSGSRKPRKLPGVRQRRAVSKGLKFPAQAMVKANSKRDRRFSPIWFSLVSSNDQGQDAPLPQISSCYLRVKDGSLPVSFIKKYLVQKLHLASEAEVEILLRGQPVISTLQLHNLVDIWLQTAPSSEGINASVGSSAKNFVMVLSYCRKAQLP